MILQKDQIIWKLLLNRENTWRSGAGRGHDESLTAGTLGKLLLNILRGQFVAVPQLCESAASGFQIKKGGGVTVVTGERSRADDLTCRRLIGTRWWGVEEGCHRGPLIRNSDWGRPVVSWLCVSERTVKKNRISGADRHLVSLNKLVYLLYKLVYCWIKKYSKDFSANEWQFSATYLFVSKLKDSKTTTKFFLKSWIISSQKFLANKHIAAWIFRIRRIILIPNVTKPLVTFISQSLHSGNVVEDGSSYVFFLSRKWVDDLLWCHKAAPPFL